MLLVIPYLLSCYVYGSVYCALYVRMYKTHMTAAKRVCRYLKGTIDIKLVYTETVCEAVGYSDADWASSVDDRHSTSGNVMLIAGGAVSWLSKRQTTVALSTAEAEYVSLTTMIQEAICIRRLLQCIGEKDDTVTVFEDNQGVTKMAQNPVMHSRTKHIDIRLLLAIPYLLSCYVYGSVYCALYVRMCEWFFECTMRVLVGFRGVGWPVRWRHLSEGADQSALRK